MVQIIICSVGTSAAKKLGVKPQDLTNWINQQKSVEDAAEKVFATFREFLHEEENLKNNLSAEIHSLFRIKITDQDRIILLASSTDDGYCCALAVEKYLKLHWKGIDVEVKKVRGLQVSDAELFRTEGVVEFVKYILKEIEKFHPSNIILNPTGGFKALVPYTVLLGMLKGIKCNYIFEQSTTLLELPPLPVEFKRTQFEAYKNLFEKIERETAISQAEWEQQVPYSEREVLKSLVEFVDNGLVTLSALGFLFLEEMRSPSALVPFLSQKAIRDCFDNLKQLDNCDPFRFLSRAASKDAFQQYEHINVGNGLRWLKPGNTTDRYLVSVEGWRMLVWRAIREDQEGANYASQVRVNPETERRAYSPFMRMDFVD